MLTKIKTSWNGARITFSFMDCPTCKKEISAKHCPEIEKELEGPRKLKQKIIVKALERAKIEGIDQEDRLMNPEDEYFNDLQAYAIKRLSYYMCFTCNDPYFGGKRDCGD